MHWTNTLLGTIVKNYSICVKKHAGYETITQNLSSSKSLRFSSSFDYIKHRLLWAHFHGWGSLSFCEITQLDKKLKKNLAQIYITNDRVSESGVTFYHQYKAK